MCIWLKCSLCNFVKPLILAHMPNKKLCWVRTDSALWFCRCQAFISSERLFLRYDPSEATEVKTKALKPEHFLVHACSPMHVQNCHQTQVPLWLSHACREQLCLAQRRANATTAFTHLPVLWTSLLLLIRYVLVTWLNENRHRALQTPPQCVSSEMTVLTTSSVSPIDPMSTSFLPIYICLHELFLF